MLNNVNKLRPNTTLFMLMSVDGKISFSQSDNYDFDKHIPYINGDASKGLHQYYEYEQETSLWSLNSGRVFEKIGINEKNENPQKTQVNFVIIDNKGHLNENGIIYMSKKSNKLFIFDNEYGSNVNACKIYESKKLDNLIYLQWHKDPYILMEELYKYNCDELTIQTGGELNGLLLRNHLIDKLEIIVCPIIIGGKNVSTLIDGEDINITSLNDIGILKLEEIKQLNDSYILLKYTVINNDLNILKKEISDSNEKK